MMKRIIFIIVLSIFFKSCYKSYDDNEVYTILEDYLEKYFQREKIKIKNIDYNISKEKYYIEESKYYQYNLTYYQMKGKDTIYITISFFTDDAEIRIIESNKLECWKE